MYFLYSLLLALAFVVLLPRFILDVVRKGKYAAGFQQRLGSVPVRVDDKPVIWVHCVSVGETQAARPLILALKRRFPFHSIVVSTVTQTGQELAQQISGKHIDQVIYFPFDWRWSVRRTLRAIKPAAVLIMETELWPRFLRECRSQQIPVAIVNGRMSNASFRRYRLIRPFMADVLKSIRLAVMQTERDADRLKALGLEAERIRVAGNLKFDAGVTDINEHLTHELQLRFNLRRENVVIAASTHAPEEQLLLQAFKLIVADLPSTRLIVAPRHPERFTEVATLIGSTGLRWARRSAHANQTDAETQVILLDSIGELRSVYPSASVAFVGGSIVRHGGQNILEPAAAGCAIVIGAHTHNFHSIVQKFVEAHAVIQLPPLADDEAIEMLATEIRELLSDSRERDELATRAAELLEQNRGATQATLDFIDPIIQGLSHHSKSLPSVALESPSTT